MVDRDRAKRWLKLGSWAGGILAVVVALVQDVLFADALQGTWLDAIASDLTRILGTDISPSSPVVYLVLGIVLLLLFFVGRFLGMFFTLFIYRFMEFLTSGHDSTR